jgi:hypothetical protein
MSYTAVRGERIAATSLGRPRKYTPQLIQQIDDLITTGESPEDIAAFIGVTVASLKVTCRRLGLRLRRRSSSSRTELPPTVAPHGAKTAATESTVASHVPNTDRAESAIFRISLYYHGKEQSTPVPLTLNMIFRLSVEASSRNLKISDLLGELLQAVTEKNLFEQVLKPSCETERRSRL